MASLQLAPSAPPACSLCCEAAWRSAVVHIARRCPAKLAPSFFLCRTREDTLQRAQEIFGADNQDLFVAFKARAQRKSTRRCEPHKGLTTVSDLPRRICSPSTA